ncbi:hypothetical protein D3C81_1641120 [compost metagenome]
MAGQRLVPCQRQIAQRQGFASPQHKTGGQHYQCRYQCQPRQRTFIPAQLKAQVVSHHANQAAANHRQRIAHRIAVALQHRHKQVGVSNTHLNKRHRPHYADIISMAE